MSDQKREIFIAIVVLFLFGFILVSRNFEYTGRLVSEQKITKSTYTPNENLKGNVDVNLEARDLLPSNSKVKLSIGQNTLLETDLLSFVSNAEENKFGKCDYGVFTNKDQAIFSNVAGYGLSYCTKYDKESYALRGDANADGLINNDDITYLTNYIFGKAQAPVPIEIADVNADNKISQSDTIYLVNYLNKDGQPPMPLCLRVTRGDVNNDETINDKDVVYISDYIFNKVQAPNPLSLADVNDDGSVTQSDSIYLINYLYKNGPPPKQYGFYDAKGDVNNDKKIDQQDITDLTNYIFGKGSAPVPFESGDINNDGKITLGDVVYLTNYIFKKGPMPIPLCIKTLRGDINSDAKVNEDDIKFLVNYIFNKGPAPSPLGIGDVNNDGSITLADSVYLANYIYRDGKAPVTYSGSRLRGDVNNDGLITQADINDLTNYIFGKGNAPNPLEVGDVNLDGTITLADVVYLANYLYKNGPAPVQIGKGDVNNDGTINQADVDYLTNYIFGKGPAPNPLSLGDVNNDGSITLSDVILIVNNIYKDGLLPANCLNAGGTCRKTPCSNTCENENTALSSGCGTGSYCCTPTKFVCSNTWDNGYTVNLENLNLKAPSSAGSYYLDFSVTYNNKVLAQSSYPINVQSTSSGEGEGSSTCIPDWRCTEWTFCSVDGKQTRSCIDRENCGIERNRPEEERNCVYSKCTENWECSEWSNCEDGAKSRVCLDRNACGTKYDKPETVESCESPGNQNILSLINPKWPLFWIFLPLVVIVIIAGIVIFTLTKKEKDFIHLEKKHHENKLEHKPVFRQPEIKKSSVSPDFIEPELEDYVKKAMAKGTNKEQIKKDLLKVGWKKEIIEKALNKYK